MLVYVETNYILEIAFQQDQYNSCEAILDLAQENAIQVIIPAFSFAEPFDVIYRNGKSRRELSNRLITEIKQLARSEKYRKYKESIDSLSGLLIQSQEEELMRFISIYNRLLACAQLIDTDALVLKTAMDLYRRLSLHLQDSIVLASILQHLEQTKPEVSCFLNKNEKDFDNPNIANILEAHGCRTIFSFTGGLHYIRKTL